MLGDIEFGIFVAPLVIFLFGDLTLFQFGRHLLPCLKHIEQRSIAITVGFIQTQTKFPGYFTYYKSVHLPIQRGVHNADVGVYVEYSEGMGDDIKDTGYFFYIRKNLIRCPIAIITASFISCK